MGPIGGLSSSLDPAALGGLRGGARAGDDRALEAAARQLESLFLNQLLKSMRAASDLGGDDGSNPFESRDTRLYTSLLDEQLANRLASGPGIGLADRVIAEVRRSRDGSVPAAAATAIKNPAAGPI